MSDPIIEGCRLVLLDGGFTSSYRGKPFTARTWAVLHGDDERIIGYIAHDLLTRERRTPGRCYVNARWQSPGWTYRTSRNSYAFETSSRVEAVRALLRGLVHRGDREARS